jgi:hypothetical protein
LIWFHDCFVFWFWIYILLFLCFWWWWFMFAVCWLSLLGRQGKGLGIGVRCRHKILGSNFTQCVIDIWNIMYAYDGWACSIEMQASRWEVLLDPIKGNLMFNFNWTGVGWLPLSFDSVIKSIINNLFSHLFLNNQLNW